MSGEKPPPIRLWLRELPLLPAIWVNKARRVKPGELKRCPREGQPVLVFPGILSGDRATSLLRRSLDAAGFRAFPSTFRLVTGVNEETFAQAEARLDEVAGQCGCKPVLVGWSLGGIIARVLAQRHPDKVAMVVTLGSPFSGDRHANNAWRIYNAMNDHTVDDPPLPDDPSVKPPVHTVALWSRNDGVIAPECARGRDGERDVAIEVPARHFAYGSSRRQVAEIVGIISEQLARIDDS
ncbi:esterase/lipase family protein [Qipengyuania nanhaisediminis]|uniref:esterase/lipase family protein n=1 Tax=Qipengyuania nanhaisediminis TaxID=604088 RepID=UPI0038B2376B